jgi:2-amino-4-hydroxy-6-hydroxymethyldihydropteridine diphosphokinase
LKKSTTYLSLGSNVGDRTNNLKNAIKSIENLVGKVNKISKFYKNPAVGFDGNSFVNICIEVVTYLSPNELLNSLLNIENEYGRKRLKSGEYSSRTIDIDIIFYENLTINQNGLIIPHPRMQSRHFVLVPMYDLNPDFVHPVLGLKTSQLLDELETRGDIVDINFSLED